MQYITGQHALNIPCPLLTCGDWHQSAIQWKYPLFRNSNDSVFGDYGIEKMLLYQSIQKNIMLLIT